MNKNKDIKNMTAADLVSQIRIGWNIGNTLDATNDNISPSDLPSKSETAWKNPVVTEELIDTVIKQGFNIIRIPTTWANHVEEGDSYTITKSWMDRVQEVVDYAYNKGIYVILNLHHEDWNYPYYDNEATACNRMRKIWKQIADRFEDYDEHLIFEAQNEPRKVGTSLEWSGGDKEGWDVVNATNKAFVETIRSCGGLNPYRMLMLPGYAASSTVGLRHIELPQNDNRIIVSVHCYSPYDFALNVTGRADWKHDTYEIDKLMEDLKSLYIDKGTPAILGEFGAMNKENEEDRAAWADYFVTAATATGVPCVWWDNGYFTGEGELFGLIDRYSYEVRYPKLLDAMMKVSKGK